jgi:hypothetical protein
MDLRHMILAGGLTAAGGAGVAAWKFSPDAAVTAGSDRQACG